MKNIGYLQCQKGGYHAGQYLNIVCFQPGCKENLLCCCACIQEMHQNHKTKTLKKIILDAQNLLKTAKQSPKVEQKPQKISLNTDIMHNMIENEQKNIISKLKDLKNKILKEYDDLESSINTYYKSLHQEISKPQQKGNNDPKAQLAEAVQTVQGSADIEKLKKNVLKLIRNLSIFQSTQNGSNYPSEQPSQQSYLNFLKNSNIDISNIVNIRIQSLSDKIENEAQQMKKIIGKIESFWTNSLFTFSNDMHHSDIDLLDKFTILANVDSVYQMALMNPCLSFKNGVETFTFRINVNDLEWVAVGVCYKNIVKKHNFSFAFNQNGHGCYLVSGNAGTWSHSQPQFNNYVKAFNFKQGDSITCTVTPNKICFYKNVKPQIQESLLFEQKQFYELEIKSQPDDTLHPCVVCYYMNTEVEYIPSFKNLQLQMPSYPYKFCKESSHDCTIISNDTHLLGCDPTTYKCCVLDNPIQKSPAGGKKSVTFRIVRSTNGWIGIGLCHKKIVNTKHYDFEFSLIGHGCYMISANGGSWSHKDPENNNLVKTFKFVEGDLITVSIDEEIKLINFKKGIDSYKLSYESIEGDELYPVVVLYYPEDQVEVLPDV